MEQVKETQKQNQNDMFKDYQDPMSKSVIEYCRKMGMTDERILEELNNLP